MAIFLEEHGDHFTYLKNRARARNIPVIDTNAIEYFQDINKFLTLFGLQNIIDDEDIVEQQYAIGVFNQYQLFANELRVIKRELAELKIEMTRNTIMLFYDLIEQQRETLNSTESNTDSPLARHEYRLLKIKIKRFIAETEADIDRMEKMLRLDELKLSILQQEKLS